jgi:peptidoglycan-associated lipoprotein
MKRTLCLNAVAVLIAVLVGGVGCKKSTKPVTPIPARTASAPGPAAGPGPIAPGGVDTGGASSRPLGDQSTGGTPLADMSMFEGMRMDTNTFATATVYFDFDSSVVKSSEQEKIASVATELKGKPTNALLIDGHCDERGTEEYNRALGERRALALRDSLISLGIAADRIRTRSWGENMPVALGHDESAWRLNRRGEFILLLPP